MKLPSPLIQGKLIQRYKRFLADVQLSDGSIVTAHSANSGSMMGCQTPGSPVLLSQNDNPKRKLKYTWELVWVNNVWVGINTNHPNKLVREGIENRTILELQNYQSIRPEVKYGENSRIDLLLESGHDRCYVEVKNVTLIEKEYALFPDAVTTRGQKHLRELMNVVKQGDRGVIFFVVQREDANFVAPADEIDPVYGQLLRDAVNTGMEAIAYRATVSPKMILLEKKLPVVL